MKITVGSSFQSVKRVAPIDLTQVLSEDADFGVRKRIEDCPSLLFGLGAQGRTLGNGIVILDVVELLGDGARSVRHPAEAYILKKCSCDRNRVNSEVEHEPLILDCEQ